MDTEKDAIVNKGTVTAPVVGSVPAKNPESLTLDLNSSDDWHCLNNEYISGSNLSTGETSNGLMAGESEVYDNDRRSPASTAGTMDTEMDEMMSQGTVSSVRRSLVDSDYGSTDSEEEHNLCGALMLEKAPSPGKTEESVRFSVSGLLSLAEVACQLIEEPVCGSIVSPDSESISSEAIDAMNDQSRIVVGTDFVLSQSPPSLQRSVSPPLELGPTLHCQPTDLINSPVVERHVDEGNDAMFVPQTSPLERTDAGALDLETEETESRNLMDQALHGDGPVLETHELDQVSTAQEIISADLYDDLPSPVTKKSSDVELEYHDTGAVDTCARDGDDTAMSAVRSSGRAKSTMRRLSCDPELPVSTAKRRCVSQDDDQRLVPHSHQMVLRQSGALSRLRSEQKRLNDSKVLPSVESSSDSQPRSSRHQRREQSTGQTKETAEGVAQKIIEKPKSLKTDKVRRRRRKTSRRKSDLESSVKDIEQAREVDLGFGGHSEQSEVKQRLCEESELYDRKRKSRDSERETLPAVRTDRKRRRASSSSHKESSLAWSRDEYADRHQFKSRDDVQTASSSKQRKGCRGEYRESADTYSSYSVDGSKNRSDEKKSSKSDRSRSATSKSGTSRSDTNKSEKKKTVPRSPVRRPRRSSTQEHDLESIELDTSHRRKSQSKGSRDKKKSHGKSRRTGDKARGGRR